MKFGKMRYLSLLDFSSSLDEERTLIIQPLAQALIDTRKSAENRIKPFEEDLANNTEEVWDENTGETSHDIFNGRIDDIAYEYQLQEKAICTSLIIVGQSYLHSKFQNILSAYKYFKRHESYDKIRDYYFGLGEKVNDVSWAEALKAASNYVRHFEEWPVKAVEFEQDGDHIIRKKVSGLIHQLQAKFQATPRTLIGLGFSEEEVFDKRNNLTPQIAEKLKLTDPDEFSRLTSVWLKAVMDDLHAKFDHLDK